MQDRERAASVNGTGGPPRAAKEVSKMQPLAAKESTTQAVLPSRSVFWPAPAPTPTIKIPVCFEVEQFYKKILNYIPVYTSLLEKINYVYIV